jgi:GT2 family glycosyltransferase
MKVTATIVVYKPKMDWLLKSIHSFIDKNHYNKKLYIIDNSPARNEELGRLQSSSVEYIFNNKNLGFGKAHNMGIRKAIEEQSDYHLILNPDISFDSEIIAELADVLDKDDSIGFISPKIFYTHGELQKLCKILPSPKHLIFRRFLRRGSHKLDNLNYELELRAFGYNSTAEIPWLSACFLLARTSHLEKIGGFDERYFMYMEDVDISRRSLQYFKNVFYPNVSIQHVFEKGSYKSLRLTIIHMISAFKYFTKWGWFIDKEKDRINQETLRKLGIEIRK